MKESANKQLKFIDKTRSTFIHELRHRVDAYFEQTKKSKHANFEMFFKFIFYFGSAVLLYALIISNYFSAPVMLVFALLLGAFTAFIGFNISHDAIHGSYTSSPLLNKILGLSFNLIGANAYIWSITHNILHHTYTNIPGHDEDIEVAPNLVRLSPEAKLTPIMRYQHLYAFLLYGLASFSWVFRKDYLKFSLKKIGQRVSNHPPIEYFNLFFFKAVYYFLFIALPLMVLDITWWQFMIGFLGMHLVEGLVLGLVFQLAHVVEGTAFPLENEEGNIEEAWAIHQLQTTANFACDNYIVNFLCGGLNMQIEHHLFPKVCHVHYPKIAPIVKATAAEYGLPYIENKTFVSALRSHFAILKQLGKESWEKIDQAKKIRNGYPIATCVNTELLQKQPITEE